MALSRQKARLILHEGTAQGHAITDRQRRYFGAVSSGYASGDKPRKRKKHRGKRRR